MIVAELVAQLFTKDPNARVVFRCEKGMLRRELPTPVICREAEQNALVLSFMEKDEEPTPENSMSQGVLLGLLLGIFLSVLCWLGLR